MNKLPLFAAALGLLVPAAAIAGIWYYGSPKFTDVGYRPIQPVPYSHKLHAGELGLDCRYCHASVESSAVANIPVLFGAVFFVYIEQGLFTQNQGLEFTALVFFLLIVLLIYGPGRWSVDNYLAKAGPPE